MSYQNFNLNVGIYEAWAHAALIELDTTVTGANVSTTQSQFPTLIRFTAGNFTFADAMANGEDIRFTDITGLINLEYEIERWDNVGDLGEIWIRITSIPGNLKSFILMFWGKPGSSAVTSPPNTVRTADSFEGVWHFNDASAPVLDATSNSNDFVEGTAPDYAQAALIGKGLHFDQTNSEFLTAPNSASLRLGTADAMISWWMNVEIASGTAGIYSRNGATQHLSRWFNDDIINRLGSGFWSQPGGVPDGSWHHIVQRVESASGSLFVDGVEVKTGQSVGDLDNTVALLLGKEGNNFFDGLFDEFRWESTARSNDWIKLNFQNQQATDTLITFGPVIGGVAAPYYYNNLLTGT